MNLAGKVVLVTGGGSGIGAASARYMAARGARVAVAGIPAAAVAGVAEDLGADRGAALGLTMDVRHEAEVAAAVHETVTHFGRLDAAVANAGIQRHTADVDLFAMDEAEWALTQDVNLNGVMRTCKHAIAAMMRGGEGGSIVIMSSVTALSGLSPNASYSTAKSGLLGLSRHIAVQYARHGIRCNAICPGPLTETPDWADHPDPAGREAAMTAAVPLGRLGTPEDIAPWVAFLASDDAGFATGGCYVVDGGLTAR